MFRKNNKFISKHFSVKDRVLLLIGPAP